MATERIEAVKKVSDALSKQQTDAVNHADGMDHSGAGAERFQSLVDASKPIQPSFQPLNNENPAPEGIESKQQNPIFAEDNVSTQKNGSATDQENKKRQHSYDEDGTVGQVTNKKSRPTTSLMDEVQKLNTQVSKAKHLSPEDLKHQAKDMIAQLDGIKSRLAEPDVTIKPSYQTLLRNRLTHIDDNLKIALNKAGVEYVSPALSSQFNTTNPIQRFIGSLTSSQYQLEHLHQTIEQLNLTNRQLTPANMLAMQMKVGYVQQQIELFTSLLNKALESTKTIMNVQV